MAIYLLFKNRKLELAHFLWPDIATVTVAAMDTSTPKKKKMNNKASTKKKKKKKKTNKKAAEAESTIAAQQKAQDFTIAPSAAGPSLKTSDWPLLLKNFDKLNVRTGHYTPIPSGEDTTLVYQFA